MSASISLDPRAERSRAAVLAAARALLQEEGPAAVTHQRVAQRAGVGRATVYRHWPRPELLLMDALAGVELPFFAEAPAGAERASDTAAWLRAELRRLADELALPTMARVTATLLQTAQWDPAARHQLDRWLDVIDRRLQGAGITHSYAHDASGSVAALLIGPLVYRAVLQARPVSDALIDRLVAAPHPNET